MSFDLHSAVDCPPHAARPGLPLGKGLHEFYATTHADVTCLSGCALMLALAMRAGACLWVRHAGQDREAGEPSPMGLVELGIDPTRIILLASRDPACALQAGLEGSRCSGLSAVIVEIWGETNAYDLTASRRLASAAKASGVPMLVARIAASPMPSAAETRWQVRAVPSSAMAANAPGNPAFEMTLLRARNGQEGLCYRIEWNRDACKFFSRPLDPGFIAVAGDDSIRSAPLSRFVVPVSFDRPGAPPAFPRQQAG